MKSPRPLSLIAILAAFASSPTVSQTNPQFAELNDDIEMTRTILQAERKELIQRGMSLTPEESAAFWPVYNQYAAELAKHNDKLVKLITDYAANYRSMTDATAKTLLNDYFDWHEDVIDLREKYVKRFAKAVPMVKVARLMQLEGKIDTVRNLGLVRQIPLVE